MSTNSLITFVAGQKIKASETNQNNNFILEQINKNIEILRAELNTKLEEFKSNVSSGALKVGDIKLASYDTVPETFLVCNGASLLIEDYSELYDKIGATYGQVDDYHFNIPDLRDKVPEGFKNTSEPFGSTQKGKIPNITASFTGGTNYEGCIASGAVSFRGDTGDVDPGNGRVHGNKQYNFNASKCSSVYDSNVTRVTVDRVKINFLIKYKD